MACFYIHWAEFEFLNSASLYINRAKLNFTISVGDKEIQHKCSATCHNSNLF
jgi:hypothetical protein